MPVCKDDAKNGYWKVKLNYKTWDGKYKSTTKRGFKTKSEAAKWEMEFKLKIAGTPDMSLESFVETYLENLKMRIRGTTLETKKTIIYKWIIPYLGNKPINGITNMDIIAWQNMLMNQRNEKDNKARFKSSYLKTIHNQLSAILNYAKRYYGLPNNPASTVGNMGTDKDIKIDYWTKDEYLRFKDEVSDYPEYYYCYEVLYWCGLREGELLALTFDDIDFDNKIISISKTLTRIKGQNIINKPKTEKGNRRVRMPDFLCKELIEYKNLVYKPKGTDRVFPVTKTNLTKVFKQYTKKAGLKEIRIHDLRHSHVSLLISLGIPPIAIADRVGHESIYITYHYAHLYPEEQTNLTRALDNVSGEE